MLGGQVDGGDLDALTGEGHRVVTRPGAEVDQVAPSLVPEALKEATPEVGAALTEPPLLTLRSLSVVEGDHILFERRMGDHFSRNLDPHNQTKQASRPSAEVPD